MNRFTLIGTALLAPTLLAAVPALAQPPRGQAPYYDPSQPQPYDHALQSYDDDETGYTGGYSARSGDARPGGPPPSTTYAPPAAAGAYGRDQGYAAYPYAYGGGAPGYGGGQPGYDGGPAGYGDGGDGGYYGDDDAPPPPGQPRSTRPAARSPYADRIARWRARADACEAGDTRACNGPE